MKRFKGKAKLWAMILAAAMMLNGNIASATDSRPEEGKVSKTQSTGSSNRYDEPGYHYEDGKAYHKIKCDSLWLAEKLRMLAGPGKTRAFNSKEYSFEVSFYGYRAIFDSRIEIPSSRIQELNSIKDEAPFYKFCIIYDGHKIDENDASVLLSLQERFMNNVVVYNNSIEDDESIITAKDLDVRTVKLDKSPSVEYVTIHFASDELGRILMEEASYEAICNVDWSEKTMEVSRLGLGHLKDSFFKIPSSRIQELQSIKDDVDLACIDIIYDGHKIDEDDVEVLKQFEDAEIFIINYSDEKEEDLVTASDSDLKVQFQLVGDVNITGISEDACDPVGVGAAVYTSILSAEVTNSNASEFTYQWTRYAKGGTEWNIEGATDSSYQLTEEDIDRTIKCRVRDKSGRLCMDIDSAPVIVHKEDGLTAPENLEGIYCSKGGANDGCIKNVDATMEYSSWADVQFTCGIGIWYDCTGDTINGLAPGTYYVRYKGSDTRYGGTAVRFVIGESVTGTFSDVSKDKWYVNAIQFCYDQHFMSGKGKDPEDDGKQIFDPNGTITRAEFATVLYNMSGKQDVDFANVFSDVQNESAWYTKPVLWLYSKEIASGYGNGYFGVSDPITREQMALMLYKYSIYLNSIYDRIDMSYQEEALQRFGDADQISSWADQAMKWAVTKGVVKGSAHEVPLLNPKGNATRAECAAMIKNLFENDTIAEYPPEKLEDEMRRIDIVQHWR